MKVLILFECYYFGQGLSTTIISFFHASNMRSGVVQIQGSEYVVSMLRCLDPFVSHGLFLLSAQWTSSGSTVSIGHTLGIGIASLDTENDPAKVALYVW
jgi:hypothetical protein